MITLVQNSAAGQIEYDFDHNIYTCLSGSNTIESISDKVNEKHYNTLEYDITAEDAFNEFADQFEKKTIIY